MGSPSLNKALPSVLSECVRRSRIGLPQFIELMRGQTADDYRPNKRMLSDAIRHARQGYRYIDALLDIAAMAVHAPLVGNLPRQDSYPANHKSTDDRYSVLVKNIRKEQDNWRCFVFDLDILVLWPEVRISPFGVVDKGDTDPRTTGRVIHDLSFPDGASINDSTDTASICTPTFENWDAIAAEIMLQQEKYPNSAEIKLQAGDVASAFRNMGTHSESVYLFGADFCGTMQWLLMRQLHLVTCQLRKSIAHIHGSSINRYRAVGPFNYYWVDDHINAAADIGANCGDVEQSLRQAVITVLGHGAINEDKFTPWRTQQQVLGLVFDSTAKTVAMPEAKIRKAVVCVRAALQADALSRADYQSLLGRLRHVASCVRPARRFLQTLRQQERHRHRSQFRRR